MTGTGVRLVGLLMLCGWLSGCESAEGASPGMREWVQMQKPGPVAALEPWPELAAEGQPGAPAAQLRDPFAGNVPPQEAASAALRTESAKGTVFLGTIQGGAAKAAVMQQDGHVQLVRAGKHLPDRQEAP